MLRKAAPAEGRLVTAVPWPWRLHFPLPLCLPDGGSFGSSSGPTASSDQPRRDARHAAARRLGAALGHRSGGAAPSPSLPAAAAAAASSSPEPPEPFAPGWPAGISPPQYQVVPRFPVGDPKVLDYLGGAPRRPLPSETLPTPLQWLASALGFTL